ncbi:hypothetical protein ZEAMMB73_Zm00001d013606 [Zea mays]|uniref:Uncharacterized protein n=1 Tax=Zea mays TaxID=4577 RepID=A0A1D6GKX4_MAIZE|nr:hypothetical protein ZEAMMB73_Zm00001d013606 [Zea mays]
MYFFCYVIFHCPLSILVPGLGFCFLYFFSMSSSYCSCPSSKFCRVVSVFG